MRWMYWIFVLVISIDSCKKAQITFVENSNPDALFKMMSPNETGIDFANSLRYDRNFNIYKYRNFYNGGGVAIGDINNDSLPDIYFTANMGHNKLYLNKGHFKFEDITDKAGVAGTKAWSTGVAMADINGDGLLDIYVCNSGDIRGDNKENELFINQGNLTFKEMAASYGLNDKGYTTHAAFFDYDKDGDLDCYILNNSYKAIGSFNLRNNIRETRDTLGGDKLMRNDGDHFTDVSQAAGIYGSLIGFGLGVTVGDVNDDGWQDIYVSNDFFERDYLYINQKNGTFKEDLTNEMNCISAASMGADMADINNDGHPDIFVTDMLPGSERRLKTKTTFEDWNKYQYNVKNGYYHQFIRNMLHLNHGDGTWSDIGRLAGVYATDWSWGALMFDMDLDGKKDIFVANGIYKDLTDQDYLSFISDEHTVRNITKNDSVDYKQLIDSIPSEAIPNYAFHNEGNLAFNNKASEWGLATPSYSNGAAYADLDNDGDLDLIVNNVNMPCFVYQNQAIQKMNHHYLKIKLTGIGHNAFAYGSKVKAFVNGEMQYIEHMPIRGFESSMDPSIVFGLGSSDKIDSLVVRFPDDRYIIMKNVASNQTMYLKQTDAKEIQFKKVIVPTLLLPITVKGLDFVHREDDYSDFDQNRLMYQMLSNEGPKAAVGDLNGDHLDDIYIGQGKGSKRSVWLQKPDGSFIEKTSRGFENIQGEDIGTCLFDADGDHDLDLYVCEGGNEDVEASTNLIDKLYINDGHANFTLSSQILPTFHFESTSCVRAADIDQDGDQDLFVGVRVKPLYYGVPVNGYILINDGKGNFTDQTNTWAASLTNIGMITDVQWADLNNDKKVDLVVCGEYLPVKVFLNNGKSLVPADHAAANGWWSSLFATDLDQDGDIDLIAGNHGLNSRFKAYPDQPIRLYINDFDQNGTVEQVLTSFREGREYPFVLKHDLISQIPSLKKKFLKYSSFAGQTIQGIFSDKQMQNTIIDTASWLQSSVLLNDGKGYFKTEALPVEAQFSPVYAVYADDFDHDGKPEIILGGNQYRTKPETGRYDASWGLVLNRKKDQWTAMTSSESGIQIRGEIRDIKPIKIKGKKCLLIARNNDTPLIYSYK